ncbi:MAG TPA: hypothetical protein VMC84_04300 [Methanocella sp.]|nr:hypothetical protein [Methanocella sp.]HTY90377.1 hypothetical protein [Methanocella sp.]
MYDILNYIMGFGTMFDAAFGHGTVLGSGFALLAKFGYPLCGGFW